MAARKTTKAMGWPQRVEMNAAIIAAGMMASPTTAAEFEQLNEYSDAENRRSAEAVKVRSVAMLAVRIALAVSDIAHDHFDGTSVLL